MATVNLKAEERKILGKKVRTLRREGIMPANVYGKKTESLAIQLSLKEFEKAFEEAGETTLVELQVGAKKLPVLIHHVQKDFVNDSFVHADFLQVDLKEKVTANVPVESIGESPAEKQALGTVVLILNEVEVEALPTDLPEKFEIDKSSLTEVDQIVKVMDLKVDKAKVDVKSDLEAIVVKVEPPQKEEVVEPAPVAEGAEGAPAEGEAPAGEGEQAAEEAPKAEESNSGQSA